MADCTHHWTVTSPCPFCQRAEIERLRAERKGDIDANRGHPAWEDAPREDILDALRFQGATTKALIAEADGLRVEVAALQDQRREMHADMADLATLVRRLALALRKAQPEHSTVSDAAMEFLRKRGLNGEVLRA